VLLAGAARGLAAAFTPSAGILRQATALIVLVAGGAALYLGLAHLSGAVDLPGLLGTVRRRRAAE
jgi:hypothetical protein